MVRKRKENYEDLLYRHSPIKRGVIKVKNEDDTYHNYDKITNHIFLGNYKTAKNPEFFKKHNIKAVLNVTNDIPNYFCHKKIDYLRIPVEDSLKEYDFKKMYYYFPVIIEYLNKVVNIEKKNVLINCVQGRERSCIAVAIFLVSQGMSPKNALKYILKKRPEAFYYGLSLNFVKPFEQYCKYLEIKKKLPKYKK